MQEIGNREAVVLKQAFGSRLGCSSSQYYQKKDIPVLLEKLRLQRCKKVNLA